MQDLEGVYDDLAKDIYRTLLSQNHHDSDDMALNVVDALMKVNNTIASKTEVDGELVDTLNRIADSLEGIRKSAGAVAMLVEDGYCRSSLECKGKTGR